LKEIGERLRETRLSIGISIEEAAQDLKVMPSQIEDIETGNIEAFKDIFNLKYFIRDYSKYLGLNYDDMVDEFNEYLFDYTSKISIEDIKKAHKNITKEEEKKVISPYTIERKKPIKIWLIIVIFLLVCTAMLITYKIVTDKKQPKENVIAYNILK